MARSNFFSTSSRIYYLCCIICTSPLTLQKSSVLPVHPLHLLLLKCWFWKGSTSQQLRIGSALRLWNNQQFLSSTWRSHFRLVVSSSEEVHLKEWYLWGREKLKIFQNCGFTLASPLHAFSLLKSGCSDHVFNPSSMRLFRTTFWASEGKLNSKCYSSYTVF